MQIYQIFKKEKIFLKKSNIKINNIFLAFNLNIELDDFILKLLKVIGLLN